VEFPTGIASEYDEVAMQQNRVVAIIPSTAISQVQELIDAGLVET
jgi:hypothetical protein